MVDLDGVLIRSSRSDAQTTQAIYPLHGEQTVPYLANSGAAVAILTHRHNSEAEQILKLLGMSFSCSVRCYAAQDLWFSAMKYKKIPQTLVKGLRKSLILPLIQDELGYHPEDIALIDDRPEILSDMSRHGVGLTLLPPFSFNSLPSNDSTTTFNLSEALRLYEKWSCDRPMVTMQQIRLKERVVPNKKLLPNHSVIICNRWDSFSVARKMSHLLRRLIFQ